MNCDQHRRDLALKKLKADFRAARVREWANYLRRELLSADPPITKEEWGKLMARYFARLKKDETR